jgi:hypothetical protein
MSADAWVALLGIGVVIATGQVGMIVKFMASMSHITNRLTKIETILKIDYDTEANIPEPRHRRGF